MKVQNKTCNLDAKIQKILARAVIPIYYSTTTNTSKKIAYMLQQKLEKDCFIAEVTNIGDIDKEKFVEMSGPVIFLSSTYGEGKSPADGEQFMKWLQRLQQVSLQNIQFSIMGFGNKAFEQFCKNAKTLRDLLITNGAKQIIQIVLCNTQSPSQTAMAKFPQWSQRLIKNLKQKYDIKEMSIGQSEPLTKIVLSSHQIDDYAWERELPIWQPKLGKQFLAYHKAYNAKVISITEMRKRNDGNSTLLIRMVKPEGIQMSPGSNFSIYPQNVRKQGEEQFIGGFQIETSKKNIKIPYPPMNLQTLWKISNFNQVADTTLIKYALNLSHADEQVKEKYSQYISNPTFLEKNPIRCWQVYEDLKPQLDFIMKLGINTVRLYTLASWDSEQNYIDIVASISPQGLTSKYFKALPKYIKIMPATSTFFVPEGRPVAMVANGAGIAPFRSIIQYMVSNSINMPQIHLYYGIRDREIDYHFKQQWEGLAKQGKIKIKIAQSRVNPQRKFYVQDLLKEDRQFIYKHIFQNKGVVFICGSSGMVKSVSDELYEVIQKQEKLPFKAFKLFTQLNKNKIIVKQVFS